MLSQSVIGPYETVTLESSDPSALDSWLTVNGYAIPDSVRPTIAAYVAEGFDFIALRLAPGQGVQAMQPVRVVTQGADPTLPLRMVAAGVGRAGRHHALRHQRGALRSAEPVLQRRRPDLAARLAACPEPLELPGSVATIMQSHGGRTWLTEYAEPASLQPTPGLSAPYCGSGPGSTPSFFGGSVGVADYYLGQCTCQNPSSALLQLVDGALNPGDGAVPPGDGALDDATPDGAADSSSQDAASLDDASVPTEASTAGHDAAPEGSVTGDAGNGDPCAGFDDLDVALVGLHPADTWVTRMRAVLAVETLVAGDLHLQASSPQTPISNQYQALVYDDPTYTPCPNSGGCSATVARPGSTEAWFVAGLFGFAGAAFVRRRRR